jgi:hypothetical protein
MSSSDPFDENQQDVLNDGQHSAEGDRLHESSPLADTNIGKACQTNSSIWRSHWQGKEQSSSRSSDTNQSPEGREVVTSTATKLAKLRSLNTDCSSQPGPLFEKFLKALKEFTIKRS